MRYANIEQKVFMANPRKEIFNNLAEKWDEMAVLNHEQKKTIDYVLDYSNLSDSDYVLDVGCGTGVLAPYILKRIGCGGAVIGLDVSDKMIEQARKKFSDTRVKFIEGDIYEYRFCNITFDKVFVFSAFPHLHNKKESFRVFYDILKADGQLIIFHVESSFDINFFHSNKVNNPVLKKDYLPDLDEIRAMIDLSKWKFTSLEDRKGLYLVVLQKNNDK